MSEALRKRLRAKRERSIELEPGRSLVVLRPPEIQMGRLKGADAINVYLESVVGWDGFTEADLLGKSLGSDSPVPFDRELWIEYAQDRIDIIEKVSSAVVEMVAEHMKARDAAAKK